MSQNITIKKLVLIDADPMPDQKRPLLKMECEQGHLNELTKFRLERLSPGQLAHETHPAVHYADTMVPALQIEGGWQAERCTFMMEVEIELPSGLTNTTVIQGYTNKRPRMEVKNSHLAEWEGVEFFINSMQITRPRMNDKPIPARFIENAASYTFMTDYNGAGPMDKNKKFSMRPDDAFCQLDMITTIPASELEDVCDTRTLMTSATKLANRESLIPTAWLGEIIKAYKEADRMTKGMAGVSPSHDRDFYAAARASAINPPANHHPFFRALMQVKSSHRMGGFDSTFTIRDLLAVQKDVLNDSTTMYIQRKGAHMPDDDYSEAAEVSMAVLGLGVPAIMSRYGITHSILAVQNDHGETVLADIRGDVAQQAIIEFKSRVRLELMGQLGLDDELHWKFEVESDLFGLTRVRYSDHNGKLHVKTFPTYADGLLSPLVFTADQDKERLHLVQSLNTFLSVVVDDVV